MGDDRPQRPATRHAFRTLRVWFTLMPLVAGGDKLLELFGMDHVLADWHEYRGLAAGAYALDLLAPAGEGGGERGRSQEAAPA